MYNTMGIHLSMLRVIFTPPQYQLNGTMSPIGVDMPAIRTQGCNPCDNLLGCSPGMSTHQLVYILYPSYGSWTHQYEASFLAVFQFHHMWHLRECLLMCSP